MKKKIKKYPYGGNTDEENKAVMSPASIVGAVGNSLNTVGQFIPEDNDNFGVSRKGQTISSGIQTGLNTAGDIASSFGPIGGIVGGALKIGSFLTKGFTAIADAVKEHRNPRDERWDVAYNPKNAGSGISFGNNNDLIEMALGGFTGEFKQYNAPSHEQGGQMIDANKNPTSNPNKAIAEIEKKENSYKSYIFSDTLEYKPNITFSAQAKKINDKYKNREDAISKNSLEKELNVLISHNEKAKEINEQYQNLLDSESIMRNGGMIKKYAVGGTLNPADPDYFTKLMQQSGTMGYGTIGPQEDVSTLGPVVGDPDNNGVIVPVPKINFPSTDITDRNWILGDVPKLPTPPDEDLAVNGQTNTGKANNKPSALEIAGYGIKGAEMIGHAIQAFKKPELVNPVYNPEENAIKNLMANRKIGNQDLLNELELQNTATKQDIADNSTSVGTMIANLQKLHANNIDSIAKITSQEQQTNNAYRGEEAQVLNNLGQQKVQAQNYAEELNTKTKANVQNQRDKFLKESIGGLGDFLLKKDVVNKDNNFQANILKQKGINFGTTDWTQWNKADVDIIKFTGELETESSLDKRKQIIKDNKEKLIKSGISKAEADKLTEPLENKYLK